MLSASSKSRASTGSVVQVVSSRRSSRWSSSSCDVGGGVAGSLLGFVEDGLGELVADLELLAELLALVLDVAGELLVDLDGSLCLDGSGGGVVAHGAATA